MAGCRLQIIAVCGKLIKMYMPITLYQYSDVTESLAYSWTIVN